MPTIHRASADPTDPSGAVFHQPVPCDRADAEAWRAAGRDLVVRGDDEPANIDLARGIENAVLDALGNPFGARYHNAHPSAGPRALPHYQPMSRPPAGHTFFETADRKAVSPS